MKVLHISSEKGWRGGEQQIGYLIEELNKKGVVSLVACRSGETTEAYCIKHDIPFISLPFKNSFDLVTAFRLMKYANKENVDLVHMHTARAHSVGILAYLMGLKSKLILTKRTSFPIKKNFLSQWKYNHPKISKILCISKQIKEVIAPSISDKDKLRVVYSGIQANRFNPETKSNFIKEKYGIGDGKILIGIVAALTAEKDHETFIKAAAESLKVQSNLHFLVIGKGNLETSLIESVEAKGITDCFTFTGFVNNVPEILPELDLFILTSIIEGLGTSILDAFASKVPVIATRTGGIPEIVLHRTTGFLVNVGDFESISKYTLEILVDSNLRKVLVKNAYAHLQEFTTKKTAEETLEIYEEVISE